MKKKIFLTVALLGIAVSLLVFAAGLLAVSMSSKNTVRDRLTAETKLACALIRDRDDVELLKKFDGSNVYRITVIGETGDVLLETDVREQMENHLSREEVAAAMKDSPKVVERYSSSAHKKMFYYAEKITLSDGETIVVRLSLPTGIVGGYVELILPVFVVLLLIVIGLSFESSGRIASSVTKKFECVSESVKSLSDGDYKPIEADSRDPELYSVMCGINGLNADIARHLEREESDRRKFEIVLENMDRGVAALDKDDNVVFANKSAATLLGGAIKKGENAVYLVGDASVYEKIIKNSGKNADFECEILGKELLVAMKSIDDELLKKEISTIIMVSDVTAEKSAARQKSEFFANASHELKTPVTAIMGLSELLLQKDDLGESVRKKIATVYSESVRMSELIADMLRLSDVERGDKPQISTDVDLRKIADDVVSVLSVKAEQKHVSLFAEGTAFAKIDKTDARELIENLASNAINYNKENGEAKIMLSEEDGKAAIAVSDTGIGIEQQHIPHLCERFYRVDKSRSRGSGGTGLGLAIVKHICMRYGATLKIESTFGQGTTVTITFPETSEQ